MRHISLCCGLCQGGQCWFYLCGGDGADGIFGPLELEMICVNPAFLKSLESSGKEVIVCGSDTFVVESLGNMLGVKGPKGLRFLIHIEGLLYEDHEGEFLWDGKPLFHDPQHDKDELQRVSVWSSEHKKPWSLEIEKRVGISVDGECGLLTP